eukprot:15481049-Alexandrium_andersonii.AAC.1
MGSSCTYPMRRRGSVRLPWALAAVDIKAVCRQGSRRPASAPAGDIAGLHKKDFVARALPHSAAVSWSPRCGLADGCSPTARPSPSHGERDLSRRRSAAADAAPACGAVCIGLRRAAAALPAPSPPCKGSRAACSR